MPLPSRPAYRWLWLLLAAAVAGVVAWPRPPRARPAAEPGALLEAEVPLGSDGATLGFRVPRPGTLEVRVDLLCEEGRTWAEVGPPGPVPRPGGGLYAPDPDAAFRFPVAGLMTAPLRRPVAVVGTYALKVLPYPVAMGEDPPRVRVRVALADDGGR